MRIAVNGLAISSEMTGIGRTTLSVLRAMLRQNTEDEFLLFLPSDASADVDLDAPNLECVQTDLHLNKPLKSLLSEDIDLPQRFKGARVDLYYTPSFLLPVFRGARAEVIGVHDLGWRLFPKSTALRFRAYVNRRLPAALKRAQRIVCPSHSTCAELLEQYEQTDEARVRVVYNGVDLDVFAPDPAVTASSDDPPFVAVIGNQDPRTNVGSLLEAFPLFRARMRPCRLVMVGPGGPPPAPSVAVDFVGSLDPSELASMYRRALMVVQPSLYEGFGLPALEAMACGTAVACADVPVFREVASDCARYFDPLEASSIAKAMEDLARDHGLRDELVRGGLERAGRFGWDVTGGRLLKVIAEAAR
jgi:alpha-1,3-rhamnosyl/mannosyltransferase